MINKIFSIVLVTITGLSLVFVINLQAQDLSITTIESSFDVTVSGDIVDNAPELSWYVDIGGKGTDINCSSNGIYCAVTYKVDPYLSVYKYDGSDYNLVDPTNFSSYPTSSMLSLDFNSDGTLLAVSRDINCDVDFYVRDGDTWTLTYTGDQFSKGYGSGELYDIAISDDDQYFIFGSYFYQPTLSGTTVGVYEYVDDVTFYSDELGHFGYYPVYQTRKTFKVDFYQDDDGISILGVANGDMSLGYINTDTGILTGTQYDTGVSENLVMSAISKTGRFAMTTTANLTSPRTVIYDWNTTNASVSDPDVHLNLDASPSESDRFGVEFLGDEILYVFGDSQNKLVYNDATDVFDVVTNDIIGISGESMELFYNELTDQFWVVDTVGLKVYDSNSAIDTFDVDLIVDYDSIVSVIQNGLTMEYTQVGDTITIDDLTLSPLTITYTYIDGEENPLYNLFTVMSAVLVIISIVVIAKFDY